MEAMVLKDKNVFPTEQVLEAALGTSYPAFKELCDALAGMELQPQWNYYNDGKAWLCKMLNKKKNLGWLSVWDGFFKTSFFFTEKHLEGIAGLDIAESVKDDFVRAKPSGKLIPIIFTIHREEQLKDVLTVVRFKKSLK
jgi:hypothetical protein